MDPSLTAPSVSELVAHIKETLEETFHEVMVEGEVSNLSMAHSGHWYFSLSDADASLSCALFKGDALRNPAVKKIKDGDKVIVLGPLSVFQKRGTFQILVKRLLPSGDGAWKLKLEALKRKLQAEGLFDPDRKRALPVFPKRVAVVTSPQGAAVQDFINVYRRRALHWDITVVPALMQGEKAPASIIAAFDLLEKKSFDVVVVTRGGGSSEDLSVFNDEALVRRVAACPFPVISAVGHQVDWTLCDYAADVRCETPTAAGETLTQPQTELKRRLQQAQEKLASSLKQRQAEWALWLERHHPRRMLSLMQARLRESTFRLDDAGRKLSDTVMSGLKDKRHRLEKAQAMLGTLGPPAVLARGYGYVTDAQGAVVATQASWQKLNPDGEVQIHWHDGSGRARKVGEGP
jgi:exodeoxyribonuclease VII large subunit